MKTFDQLCEEGIVYNMPDQVYHSISAMSASALRSVWANAAAWKWEQENRTRDNLTQAQKDTFDLGTLTHMLVLEPGRDDYAVFEGRRSGGEWKAFCMNNEDRLIVTSKLHEDAKGMADAVHEYLPTCEVPDVLDGEHEVSLFWYEAVTLDTGEEIRVPAKARLDVLNIKAKQAADFKTSKSASPQDFPWDIRGKYGRLGYDTQAWFYLRGCEEVIGGSGWTFDFLAVDKQPPYCPAVYRMDPSYLLDTTHDKGWLAVRKFAQCWHADKWPGHGTQLNWVA